MRKILIGFVAALFLSCALGLADTITFQTASGATAGGESVAASATVVTGTNQVLITLNNLNMNMTDAGQLVTDFSFTLGTTPTGSASITSQGGTTVTVNKGSAATVGSVQSPGWGLGVSGNTVTVSWFSGSPHVLSPSGGTLIGPLESCTSPSAFSGYCNPNGSLTQSSHNPFILGTLNFDLDVPGVTSSTTASNAVFSFSTSEGVDAPGSPVPPSPVPEPASLSLLGIGLISLGLLARRKFRVA